MKIVGVSLLFAVLICGACRNNRDSESKQLARAYDAVLTQNDLLREMTPALSEQDSTYKAEQFINSWLRKQALIHAARLNLPDSARNFESRLENYRNSLLIYAYEQELVSQKIDTTIASGQVEEYYKRHKKDFKLRDYLLKVVFVKVSREAPRQARLQRWFEGSGTKNLEQIEEYAHKYAENYFVNHDEWLYRDELTQQMPIKIEQQDELLKKNNPMKFEDGKFVYYLKVFDFRKKNSVAPLSVLTEKISDLILNRRKVKLVEKARDEVYNNAVNHKEIEVY